MAKELVKVLTDFDTSIRGQVVFPRKDLDRILYEYLMEEEKESLGKGEAIHVVVEDDDKGDTYTMKLQHFHPTTYHLKGGWNLIVRKRNLVAGDIITMKYDTKLGILRFHITSKDTAAGSSGGGSSSGGN